jgi:aspartyl-tRNA(Asn)/glutamyl-tRNA(Gln) amidotransferase subunit C
MSIEKQTIENLANLARIAIDDDQINKVSDRLQSVLELVDQLQAADTSDLTDIELALQSQPLREDTVSETNQRQALQAIAPETEDGLFLVPKVID